VDAVPGRDSGHVGTVGAVVEVDGEALLLGIEVEGHGELLPGAFLPLEDEVLVVPVVVGEEHAVVELAVAVEVDDRHVAQFLALFLVLALALLLHHLDRKDEEAERVLGVAVGVEVTDGRVLEFGFLEEGQEEAAVHRVRGLFAEASQRPALRVHELLARVPVGDDRSLFPDHVALAGEVAAVDDLDAAAGQLAQSGHAHVDARVENGDDNSFSVEVGVLGQKAVDAHLLLGH